MNILRYILAITITLFFVFLIFNFCVDFSRNRYGGVVIVKKGDSAESVVSKMVPDGNFIKKTLLKVYLSSDIKTGRYSFGVGSGIFDVAHRIKKGDSDVCTITFIPGKTLLYYKTQLQKSKDFSGDITVNIEEGEVMPDTYSHKCLSSRNSVLLHAQRKMYQFLRESLIGIDFKTFYLGSRKEVLTMASIIEKETSVQSEMKLIASVFKNRLNLGMRLQTDPTVIYQQSGGYGKLQRPLTKGDLRASGDYNTYVISGLPPTPIASPSREAIVAAINPKDSNFLYFVATGSGGHNFSKDYDQHVRYVDIYRKYTSGTSKSST